MKKNHHQFWTRLVCLPIYLYRWLISPLLGPNCRFAPSCSVYAIEAVQTHGPVGGSWLAVKRICRCHAWGGHGFDPVPSPFHQLQEK